VPVDNGAELVHGQLHRIRLDNDGGRLLHPTHAGSRVCKNPAVSRGQCVSVDFAGGHRFPSHHHHQAGACLPNIGADIYAVNAIREGITKVSSQAPQLIFMGASPVAD
jgi:hypothetical protein